MSWEDEARRAVPGYILSFTKAKTMYVYQYVYSSMEGEMLPLTNTTPPLSMLPTIPSILGPYPPHSPGGWNFPDWLFQGFLHLFLDYAHICQ